MLEQESLEGYLLRAKNWRPGEPTTKWNDIGTKGIVKVKDPLQPYTYDESMSILFWCCFWCWVPLIVILIYLGINS